MDPLLPLLDLPGVRAAADDARTTVDRLLKHRALRRRGGEVAAEAALRSARASAALDGVDRPLDTVRAGTADPTVQAALRLAAELAASASALRSSPPRAFARLHVLAAAGRVPEADLGRPRATAEPDDLDWLPPAPPADEAAGRLALLSDVLARTKAPAALVAAVVHGEILATRPFRLGSGLVARAAARAVLYDRGLDSRGVTAPDVGHALDPDVYRAAATAYVSGDVAAWLRHCAEATAHGAVEGLAVCEALTR